MRGGLEIIDTDQHVGPNMETLHKYAGPRLLARWDELLAYFVKVTEGALSIAWASDENVYGMWGWACAGCDLGSGFTVAALPAGDTWTKPEVPAAMNIGANHMAVTSDGTHTIFVGTMWSAGVWRYVEP